MVYRYTKSIQMPENSSTSSFKEVFSVFRAPLPIVFGWTARKSRISLQDASGSFCAVSIWTSGGFSDAAWQIGNSQHNKRNTENRHQDPLQTTRPPFFTRSKWKNTAHRTPDTDRSLHTCGTSKSGSYGREPQRSIAHSQQKKQNPLRLKSEVRCKTSQATWSIHGAFNCQFKTSKHRDNNGAVPPGFKGVPVTSHNLQDNCNFLILRARRLRVFLLRSLDLDFWRLLWRRLKSSKWNWHLELQLMFPADNKVPRNHLFRL